MHAWRHAVYRGPRDKAPSYLRGRRRFGLRTSNPLRIAQLVVSDARSGKRTTPLADLLYEDCM